MKKKLFILILYFLSFNLYSQNINEVNGATYPSNSFSKLIFKKLLDSSKAYSFKGEHEKAINLSISNLKYAKQSNNPLYIHQAYRYLAYQYRSIKDTVLVKESFIKSEKYASLSKNEKAITQTHMDFGVFYGRMTNDLQKTIYHFDKAIIGFTKLKDTFNLYACSYNAANILVQKELYDISYKYIKKAYELEPSLSNNNSSYGNTNLLFGMYYYLHKKDYAVAINYLKSYVDFTEKKELGESRLAAYKYYSDCLFKLNKLEEAYTARLKYEDYLYENMIKEAESKNAAISKEYQVSEYQKEIQTAQLENEYQAKMLQSKSTYNKILIAVSVILTFLFIWLVALSSKRKELVRLLKIKNAKYLKAKEETEKMALVKANFLSSISHELRTPLYGVIGLSTILSEDKSLKNHEADLKALKFSANHLLTLINDVLQLNKIDSKKIEKDESFFDIRELIKHITTTFKHKIEQNNNNVAIQISNKIPNVISGNVKVLSQILMNLIGNACKFTENGTINIVLSAKKVTNNTINILFTIKDDGIGIAKEKHQSIFNEFSQIKNTNTYNNDYVGSGLGLPIVKKLLDAFNSDIILTSRPGKGSAFSFSLSYQTLEAQNHVKINNTNNLELLKNKKILIVDDNKINQTVTSKILKKYGMSCDLADNGAMAVDKAKHTFYDGILMDINMPIKNGIEATYDIRKFDQQTPIIALTAVELDEIKDQIFQSGMNDIIVKPYDVNLFHKTLIKNIINKKTNSLTPLLKVI